MNTYEIDGSRMMSRSFQGSIGFEKKQHKGKKDCESYTAVSTKKKLKI